MLVESKREKKDRPHRAFLVFRHVSDDKFGDDKLAAGVRGGGLIFLFGLHLVQQKALVCGLLLL